MGFKSVLSFEEKNKEAYMNIAMKTFYIFMLYIYLQTKIFGKIDNLYLNFYREMRDSDFAFFHRLKDKIRKRT